MSISQYFSDTIHITGDIETVNGNITVSSITPALPNGDLVVLPNGLTNVFDVQTSLSRANALEVDSIDSKALASPLQLGDVNASNIQLNAALLPNANNTLDIGSNAVRFKDCYLAGALNLPNSSSALDLYVENVVIPVTYSGALVGATNITASKIGNICTLHIPQIFGASAANLTIEVIGIPAAYSPAAIGGVTNMYVCFNNSVATASRYYIDSNGISFYAAVSGGAFANTGNCGMQADLSVTFLAP